MDRESEMLHLKDLGPQRTYGTCGSPYFPSPTRQCIVHEVHGTETLAGLALKYDLTAEALRRTNNLWANDNVWPGQMLKIPLNNFAVRSSTVDVEPSNSSTSDHSSSDDVSNHQFRESPAKRKQSSAPQPKGTVSNGKDQTLQEYLSNLDKSIEMHKKKVTKDWEEKQQATDEIPPPSRTKRTKNKPRGGGSATVIC